MTDITGKLVQAKILTIGGWKGKGKVIHQWEDVVTIAPVGEDTNDKMKHKIFKRNEVSVLKKQNKIIKDVINNTCMCWEYEGSNFKCPTCNTISKE